MIARTLRYTAMAAVLSASTLLSGCAFLLVGGAMVGGTLMATDRRSSGAQIDDQSIELKSGSRVRDVLGDRGHVNVTSYNRTVLLTGEVPNEADKTLLEQAIARMDNVRAVVNELGVMNASSLSNRSDDALVTSKVKITLIDAGEITSTAFKVVTEREATRASDLIRTIKGVQKVVRVLDIVTEAELADLQPHNAPKPAASGKPL